MFLKAYTGLSAPKLMEQLNVSIRNLLFCGIRICSRNPLTNYKLFDNIALGLSSSLKYRISRGTGRSMEAINEESRHSLYRCHLLRKCDALPNRYKISKCGYSAFLGLKLIFNAVELQIALPFGQRPLVRPNWES